MRRKTGKEINQLLDTLINAHNEILRMWKSNRIQETLLLLTQCQECAIEMGNIIEEQEGKGTVAVSVLESYCEQLYKMTQMSDYESAAGGKRGLDDAVRLIRRETEELMRKSPQKIVFMPYKASMWDCMESVWEAAAADEECQAFVVPLPFIEKDNSGSTVKLCYEGESFPSCVPVIPYNEFHLEKELPDVIYIHNPYDGANIVTSIYPEYYSSNLKNFTDLLVYIPYFISGKGPLPKTHRQLPAYENADYIIVQDEGKKASLLGCVPEKKLLALGNPKIDRLMKLSGMESFLEKEVPASWRDKLSGKKVFLYNVSITGILENSMNAMKKIRYVLSRFKKRGDAVLLWRPHPLVEGTLKSMRPELYEEYMEIRREFLEEDRGILDESPDAAVSAVLADAYIGEYTSSLVHYFGVLGKPVYCIDWEITQEKSEDRRCATAFYDFYYEGEAAYFVPSDMGGLRCLCRLDLQDGRMSLIKKLPGSCQGIDVSIARIKDKIILPPFDKEDSVYVYDCKTEQAVGLVLKDGAEPCEAGWLDRIVEYKDRVYIIPRCYPAIVKLDVETMTMEETGGCITAFYEQCRKDALTPELIFLWACYRKDNLLYLASAGCGRMLLFNMDTEEYSIREIGEFEYGFGTMIYDGEFFWLAAFRKNRLVRWQEKTGESREYTYPVSGGEDSIIPTTSTLIDAGESILIFPGCDRNIISLNKKDGGCTVIRPEDFKNADSRQTPGFGPGGYLFAQQIPDNRILAFDAYDYSMVLFQMDTLEQKRFPCRLPKEIVSGKERKQIEVLRNRGEMPFSINEGQAGITEFIDYIQNCDCRTSEMEQRRYASLIANFYSGAGAAIHKCIKGKI